MQLSIEQICRQPTESRRHRLSLHVRVLVQEQTPLLKLHPAVWRLDPVLRASLNVLRYLPAPKGEPACLQGQGACCAARDRHQSMAGALSDKPSHRLLAPYQGFLPHIRGFFPRSEVSSSARRSGARQNVVKGSRHAIKVKDKLRCCMMQVCSMSG